jgi:hypothetical protein
VRRSLFSLFLVLAASCSPPRQEGNPDASTAPLASSRALDVIRAMPAFRDHAGVGLAVERNADGYRLSTTRAFRPMSAIAFRATAPAHGRAPLRVADEARAEFFVEVTPVDARDSAAHVSGSAIALDDVLPSTDIVHVIEPNSIEELRVLRDARAPSDARWTLK